MELYRIKKKWLAHLMKYATIGGLDVTGEYSKETWNRKGFKDSLLEKV